MVSTRLFLRNESIFNANNTFVCGIKECCDLTFHDFYEFLAHIDQHVEAFEVAQSKLDMLRSDTAYQRLGNGEHFEEESMFCPWKDCFYSHTPKNIQNHMYYHAHLCHLQAKGQKFITERGLPDCTMGPCPAVFQEKMIENICKWTHMTSQEGNSQSNPSPCNEKHQICLAFYDHMQEHAISSNFTEGDVKRFPDGFHCFWEGCTAKPKNSISKLLEHIRTHTGEKSIACPQCNTQFCSSTRLFDHLNCQITGQQYICSFCNKAKSSQRLLTDHLRKHLNFFKCPQCEMTCPTKYSLDRHILYKHSEQKPRVPCPYCDSTFKTEETLANHVRTKHLGCKVSKNSPKLACYACIQCSFVSDTSRKMTKHMKSVHQITLPVGFNKFQYRRNEMGIYQIVTERYEI